MSRAILSFFNNGSLYQSNWGIDLGLHNFIAKDSRKAVLFDALNAKSSSLLIY